MADTMQVEPKDVWERICFTAMGSVADVDLPELDKDVLLAVLTGASDAARAVVRLHADFVQGLDERRIGEAVLVFEVFALAMVSRFVRHLAERGAAIDRDEWWEHLTLNVLTFLSGEGTPERLREARA